MAQNISKVTFKTLKSMKDQQANQELLGRLKQISLKGGKTVQPKAIRESLQSDQSLTFESMEKLFKYNLEDPIVWSPQILGRIYNLRVDVCQSLISYVSPMMYYADNKMQEPKKLLKTSIVYDVAKIKHDKNYLVDIQRLSFLDVKPVLPITVRN